MDSGLNDLNALAGVAMAADAGAAVAEPVRDPETGALVEVPPSWEEQAAEMVNTFAGLISSYAPAAAACWPDEKRAMAASVLAPVLEKYNFSLAKMPCEIVALIVIGPPMYQSALVVRDEMAAARAAKAAAKKEVRASAAGAEVEKVAPAAGVHPQAALYKNG